MYNVIGTGIVAAAAGYGIYKTREHFKKVDYKLMMLAVVCGSALIYFTYNNACNEAYQSAESIRKICEQNRCIFQGSAVKRLAEQFFEMKKGCWNFVSWETEGCYSLSNNSDSIWGKIKDQDVFSLKIVKGFSHLGFSKI